MDVLFRDIKERKQNEEKLAFQANLFASVHDAIVAVDDNYVVTYWSGMAEEIFGWSAQEAVGRCSKKIFQAIAPDVSWEDFKAKLREDGYYIGEYCQRKDGKILYLDVHFKLLKNQQGVFNGFVASFRDITQRKQLEKNLENLRDNLIAEINVLHRLHLISIVLIQHHDDPQILYEEILDAAIELTKASKGNFQLLGEKSGYLKHVAQRGFSGHFMDHFKFVSQDRGSCGLAYKNKERVIIEDVTQSPIFIGMPDLQVILDEGIYTIQSTPLISSSGNFVGVFSTHYTIKHQFEERELQILDLLALQAADAIERTLYKEALIQSNKSAVALVEELSKANENKNRFINLLSHEIRNPLASIMMSLSLLDLVAPGGEQARLAQNIAKRQTIQLSHLVDDMMDVSRITTNKLTLKKGSVEINKLVSQIVEEYKALFAEREVQLESEIPTDVITLNADHTRLKQIIGNLLQNAAKFSLKGQKALITLAKDEQRQEAIISVQDNGIGMMPELLPELFQPFMQISESLDRAQGGLGLGLAIVKGMVELHGGSVNAYSEGLGKGAKFTIRLPLSPHTHRQQEGNQQASGGKSARPLRILVIDDIPDVVEILCPLLRNLGHEVISANKGIEGIRKAKEYRPEVLFCDIGLPEMSGYEVAENIRNDNDLKDVFLIALTGYAQTDDMERAKTSGFDRYLVKPVDLEALEQILSEVK